ncbi:MAG: MFS transporter [Candidatus Riflebacteria bacterium]|nr:MFS transporter [Candidatus Riflebacteria bacterium]
MKKAKLSFWQIWNMSFGFLGIQFGWGLQLGNMSSIYEKLGASPDQIPMLWLAAPLTGLLVQPIIGYMSDHTWNRFGRRRPYFFIGALFASCALYFMPLSSSLWMAAGLLWILDASINISMEPFRAFVADKLNDEQRNLGFVMQSFFIGIGATLAGTLPLIFRKFNLIGDTPNGIPLTVQYSFQIGAVCFFIAVLYTCFTTNEYPPENISEFTHKKKVPGHFISEVKTGASEIITSLFKMPQTMKDLAFVQIFTWLGLFCMWLYFVPMTARQVFGATNALSSRYTEGIEWGNFCFAIYSIVCFLVAFFLPGYAIKFGRKKVHSACLFAGAAGLLSTSLISDYRLLPFTMVGVGVAWASILSMPYAMLSSVLPAEKTGVYMGIFNFFIVIPEIIQALTFGWVLKNLLNNNPLNAVMFGGVCLAIAAVLTMFVREPEHKHTKHHAS